ncbi:helix-turn-helix domain-containing protein [Agromyces sp. NPDC058484]|uniref:helix-turn-helix domain-containing protein n=1 Tax=Agromyces sp. NPDC058484 TaxID=3346524 RepID=UPI0036634FD5
MMALRFRNLTVTPDDSVDRWGVEGILAAIDRGGASNWAKVAHAVEAAPHGPVAADLEEALSIAESVGVTALLRAVLDDARATPEQRTVRRLRRLARATDLSQQQLAERLGTSRSRLNSYLNGAVTPSAAVLMRLEDIARKRRAEIV